MMLSLFVDGVYQQRSRADVRGYSRTWALLIAQWRNYSQIYR
jgi:hypothetical protein